MIESVQNTSPMIFKQLDLSYCLNSKLKCLKGLFRIQTNLFTYAVYLQLLQSCLFVLPYFRASLITISEVLNCATYFALHC